MRDRKGRENLIKHSAVISVVVLIGKVLGFVKQAIIAWAFGSNALTDIYFAADGYTSMFGEIMRTSVSPTVLTSYLKLESNKKRNDARKLVQESFTFFIVIGALLVTINILMAPAICQIIGISYSVDQKKELLFYLRVLCPVMLFTSVAGVAQGYLDAHNRYVHAKLCSFFFSISIILFILFFRNIIGLRSLLYGFIFGYALHTVYIVSLVIRKTGIYIGNPFEDVEFRAMIKKFIPLVIGNSVVDLGHLIDRIVASSLSEGSVSALYYGQVISNDIVNAVIISSVGTVLLTSLTNDVSLEGNNEKMRYRIKSIMCSITIISAFLSGVYILEGGDIISLFFERGNFNSNNTIIVSSVASFYSIGFIFMANREILVKTHYAYQNTITPMINSIIGVLVNVIASVVLSKFIGVSGVALATSLSMILVCLISYITVKRHIGGFPLDRSGVIDVLKIISALIISLLVCKCLSKYLLGWPIIVRLMTMCIILLLIYMSLLFLFRTSVLFEYILPYIKSFLNRHGRQKL